MEKARGSMPFLIDRSEHVSMRDSVIREYVGHNMARISNSKWLLFEGNAISRTGHSPFQFYPPGSNQYIVVRGNVFHPAWGRAFEFFAERDLLFEHNLVTNAYDGGRSASTNAKILSVNGIFRFNRVFRNWGGPISANPEEDWQFRNVRLYHNVFDDNAQYGLGVNIGSEAVSNVKMVNNVFHRNDIYGGQRQVQLSGSGSPELLPDGQILPRVSLIGNAISAQDPEVKDTINFGGQLTSIETMESDLWRSITRTSTAVRVEGNLPHAPQFADADNYNHALASDSPLLDAGRFLTHAVGEGESTILPVEDAAYFYDGFGIKGEVGDLIFVGSPEQIARVVRVDRERKELVLDRKVVWSDGMSVSLPWSGSGPDIGVYEHGTDARPSVQVVAMPFSVQPGEQVQLSVVLHGIGDPMEICWQLGDGTLAYGREIKHTYSEPYDYPIRVRVTTAGGEVHRSTGYVVVEAPLAENEPYVHTTFDADDEDWWWRWKTYRPMPADWSHELDSRTGAGVLRVSNPGGGVMSARLAPATWAESSPVLHRIFPIF